MASLRLLEPQNVCQKNYDIVKKSYLDEESAVNFYEAKEVPCKYAVDIVIINDVEKYIEAFSNRSYKARLMAKKEIS